LRGGAEDASATLWEAHARGARSRRLKRRLDCFYYYCNNK
jgi:hypothetical protein